MLRKIISSVLLGLIFVALTEGAILAQPAKKNPPPAPKQSIQIPQVKLTPPTKTEEIVKINSVPVASGPFQVGEKLSFNVSWANFSTAARMEMEVAGLGSFFGRQGYQLKTKVQTVGSVRSMFREVDNQYTSYLDAKTLLPFRSDSAIRQGIKNEDDSILLDHQKHLARYGDNSEAAMSAEALDLPSLIFSLRLRDFSSDLKAKKISTLYGKQMIEVEVNVKQKEKVVTQAGKFEAIRVELKAKTKDKVDYRVNVWFTDDKSKMPVLFTSRLSFGELRAELTQVTVKVPNKVNLSPVDNKSGEIALNNNSGNIGIVLERTETAPSEFEMALPFSVGETVNYDIAWANIGSIGKLNLNLVQRGMLDNKVVLEMIGELSTIGTVRSIVNLNDTFKSYVQANSLTPLKTETTIHEGKRNKQIVASYKDNSVRLDNGTHFSVPANTLDLVSLYYSIRAGDLSIGKSQIYNFVDANHRPRSLNVTVVKKESINSALGVREALQLDITNLETNQLMAQTWITNDSKRIPLYIVARLAFGELRLSVKTAINTK